MNAVELLRFKWTPSELRLLLAAWADAGPVSEGDWAVRSGLPRNHLLPTLERCVALGGIAREARAEGIVLFVQPVEFWKVTPRCGPEVFRRAWRSAKQERLQMLTEMPGLAQALAVNSMANGGPAGSVANGGSSWTLQPESGDGKGQASTGIRSCGLSQPESGRQGAAAIHRISVPTQPDSGCLVPLNVKRGEGNEVTFNVERFCETGFREEESSREGWLEPDTEFEAMAACTRLFGGSEEMRLWGGRWRNRWRSNPDGLRKVLNMVREDQANGRTPKPGSNWGRYASDLWNRFVEVGSADGQKGKVGV